MTKIDPWTVTTKELADAFGCSTRAIRDMAARGVILRARDGAGNEIPGQFPFAESVQRYASVLRARKAERDANANLADLQHRKLAAQAERAEIRLAVEGADVVPAVLLSRLYDERVKAIRQEAMQLPARLAETIATETDVSKIFALLTREVEDLLTRISQPRAAVTTASADRYVTEPDEGDEEPESDPES